VRFLAIIVIPAGHKRVSVPSDTDSLGFFVSFLGNAATPPSSLGFIVSTPVYLLLLLSHISPYIVILVRYSFFLYIFFGFFLVDWFRFQRHALTLPSRVPMFPSSQLPDLPTTCDSGCLLCFAFPANLKNSLKAHISMARADSPTCGHYQCKWAWYFEILDGGYEGARLSSSSSPMHLVFPHPNSPYFLQYK